MTHSVLDTGHTLDTRVDAIYHLLAAAWTGSVAEAEPDCLREVAAALVNAHSDLPLPTAEQAHHLLAAALATAGDAHHAALAEQRAAEDAWQLFRADVRRRAGHAVNAGYICRDGTNTALREFGLDELRVEYRVDLLVPVSTYVRAANDDEAYARAEQQVRNDVGGRELTIDADDLRYDDAVVTDEDVDLDA